MPCPRQRPNPSPGWHIALVPFHCHSSPAHAYAELQRETYARHDVVSAKHTSDRCMRSCTHLVLARRGDGTVVGGLRIHQRLFGRLPIEAALPGSSRLMALLDDLDRPVELSGTVVCKSGRKTGLSRQLVRVAVAAITVVGGRSALGLGHQHVLPMYRHFGFVQDHRLGCHAYPDPRYRSRVAVLRDARALLTIAAVERSRIHQLRAAIARDPDLLADTRGGDPGSGPRAQRLDRETREAA